jgi:hypothetical protein
LEGQQCDKTVTLELIDVGMIDSFCHHHIGSGSNLNIIIKKKYFRRPVLCVWGGGQIQKGG